MLFLFLLFLIEKLLKSLLFLIFFFVSRVSRLCSENYWNALRILKRAHIFFLLDGLGSVFLSTLHTVTHWVIFTNFLSLNLKICCSKLQSCPKYFGKIGSEIVLELIKKGFGTHYKIKVNFDLIFFFLQR